MTAPKRHPTIKDVARLAGVSHSTVSRYFSKNIPVSPKSQVKIHHAAEHLDYLPNLIARGLSNRKTGIIGIVLHYDLEFVFSLSSIPALLAGISHEAAANNFDLLFFSNYRNLDYLNIYREGRVEGLLSIGFEIDEPALLKAVEQPFPLVLMHFWKEYSPFPSVSVDNRQGCRMATEHLLELGHRHIAFIGTNLKLPYCIERFQGYREALENRDIPINTDLVVETKTLPVVETGYEGIKKLIDRGVHFTAVVCIGDSIAFGAIQALKEQGFSVPEDISITGFDDISLASFMHPKLTTVKQPSFERGQMGVNLLIEAINGSIRRKEVKLKTELVVRDSTVPLKTKKLNLARRSL